MYRESKRQRAASETFVEILTQREYAHQVEMLVSQDVASEDAHSTVEKVSFFFFQAEDGIRDLTVTVQTCALPIFFSRRTRAIRGRRRGAACASRSAASSS